MRPVCLSSDHYHCCAMVMNGHRGQYHCMECHLYTVGDHVGARGPAGREENVTFDPLEVERLETQLRMQRDASKRYADRRMWMEAYLGLDAIVGRLLERGLGTASVQRLDRIAAACEAIANRVGHHS